MSTMFLLLTALLGIGWLWVDSLRTRERATALAERLCGRLEIQLLDGTVALHRMSLTRTARGLPGLRRVYRFEFSDRGDDRHAAFIVMIGSELDYAEVAHQILQEI